MSIDLFGEERIHIKDNPKLEGIANHILDLYRRLPDYLLNGDSIGEINRKIHLEIMLDGGLRQAIETVESFKIWYLDKKSNSVTEEECARALRYLAERDIIRLPMKAVQSAEQHRQRISQSVKH